MENELQNEKKAELKCSHNLGTKHNILKLSSSAPKKLRPVVETAENPPDAEHVDKEVDFEDSTLHDERMDLNVLKRKYGY